MKGMTILAMLLGLLLVWAILSHASAGGSAATDRALRIQADVKIAALQATIATLLPTPRPCGPPVAGRC